MTINDILDYVKSTPCNTNIEVLRTMLETLTENSGIDTSDATVVAGDILLGKTAYAKDKKITGTIPSKEAQTYIPSGSEQTIAAGQYLSAVQTISAVPAETKTITPGKNAQTVNPTLGKWFSSITVNGDANLLAENIKQGVTIFGVTGTYTGDGTAQAANIDSGIIAYSKGQKITGTSTKVDTSDANATAADIATGKTAYVNGSKITGTGTITPAG